VKRRAIDAIANQKESRKIDYETVKKVSRKEKQINKDNKLDAFEMKRNRLHNFNVS
jgi:cell fate (sporulation/competence/biofilm development) regulator YlbF (YheA/YmcA/DUF963 family)